MQKLKVSVKFSQETQTDETVSFSWYSLNVELETLWVKIYLILKIQTDSNYYRQIFFRQQQNRNKLAVTLQIF